MWQIIFVQAKVGTNPFQNVEQYTIQNGDINGDKVM